MRDGVVLPILHLNGYKIAGPTVLARIPHRELEALLRGCGHDPYFVEGSDPATMHATMATTLDEIVAALKRIREGASAGSAPTRPAWPMIVLRSPKGWTGPKEVDGVTVEGSFRAHQVPMGGMDQPEHVRLLEKWMGSYRPQELFDAQGRPNANLLELAPKGARRMA